MAKLINGNGNPAIYANQDADLIASLAGNRTYIEKVGGEFAATQQDANTIGLTDGVIITKEGRRIQLDSGDTDLFSIPTGTAGTTSYYIIGYKLVQAADSSQTAETFVQKMNSSSETIIEDTFKGGATEVYVSLYRVTQEGLNITNIASLLSEASNIAADSSNITTAFRDIAWYGTSSTAAATAAKVASTNDTKFTLTTGCKVKIKFTNANTASAPTLNVDSKGAKSIKAYGTTNPTVWWNAGDVVEFTYDGTNYIMGPTQGEIEQLNSDLPKPVTSRTYIDITPSTHSTRENFVPTTDGYVILVSGGDTIGDSASLFVNDGTNDYYLGFALSNTVVPCFVRKGSALKVAIGNSTNAHVRFLPLS